MSALLTDLLLGRLGARVAVVAAHYDDETFSASALLSAAVRPVLIHLTDGNHPDRKMREKAGAAEEADYIALRQAELAAALRANGWDLGGHVVYHLPDQQVVRRLAEAERRLRADLAGADVVVTHPYEGGHPDHDAAAWLVQRICAGTQVRLEFASYHLGPSGRVVGRFAGPPGLYVPLAGERLARKQAAAAAYHSQSGMVAWFDLTREAYRVAPVYNFRMLPASGRCLYERKGFMQSTDWRALVRAA